MTIEQAELGIELVNSIAELEGRIEKLVSNMVYDLGKGISVSVSGQMYVGNVDYRLEGISPKEVDVMMTALLEKLERKLTNLQKQLQAL